MLYQPHQHRLMWDTWVYRDRGVYHLYYLHMDDPRSPGDGIAHARSSDGIHWEETGQVIAKLPDAEWLGSGAVWRAGDRFIMNFSEKRHGRQAIFFAESRDLETWTRRGEVSHPDTRWYNDTPTGRWDCIYPLPRETGGFEGYLTSIPWTRQDRPGGIDFPSVGRVSSDDGIRWVSEPPPRFDWSVVPPSAMTKLAEVATIKKIGGRLYLLITAWGNFGDRSGTYAFVGDDPSGPFVPARANFRMISCRRFVMTNFLRFVGGADDLVMHHTTITRARERWFPPLKLSALDADGNLEMRWWPGNDKLKGALLPVDRAKLVATIATGPKPDLSASDAAIKLSTEARAVASLPGNFGPAAVVEATVTVTPPLGGYGGAGFHLMLAGGKTCMILAQTHGQTAFLDADADNPEVILHPWRTGDDMIEKGIIADRRHVLRLLVRGSMTELYIDDRLIHVYAMADEWTGAIGLAAETASLACSELRVWRMPVTGETKREPQQAHPGW